MWVDGFADVDGIRTHFNCKADFGDQIACARPHDRAADDAAGFIIEYEFGEAFIAAIRNRAARGLPREDGFAKIEVLRFGLIFSQAGPRDFWVGVGNRWNLTHVEEGFFTMRGLSSDVCLVYGFVREHRLANDVTDGENMRYVGAHLCIDVDEAALGHGYTCFFRADQQTIRRATNGDQYHVVALCFGWSGGLLVGFFKGDVDAVVFGFDRYGFGVDVHVVKTVGIVFLPDFDGFAIGALHQTVQHFNYVQTRAE